MEWYIGLDGRNPSNLEPEKKDIARQIPDTHQEWLFRAAVALEVIGVREATRLGDPRLWRQALSELDSLPLLPLNLPPVLWELYQAHPFEGVTLHMQDGKHLSVADWSMLYYSWHSRWFAIQREEIIHFYDATEVCGGESIRPPAAQATLLERLLWLQRMEKPVDFIIRTRRGAGVVVQGKNSFRLDPSGSFVVLKRCEEQPVEILPVSDITSIVLTNTDTNVPINHLQQHLNATPFLPFHVVMLHGRRYIVDDPKSVLITCENLFLAQGGGGSGVHDDVIEIPLTRIDRVEPIPS